MKKITAFLIFISALNVMAEKKDEVSNSVGKTDADTALDEYMLTCLGGEMISGRDALSFQLSSIKSAKITIQAVAYNGIIDPIIETSFIEAAHRGVRVRVLVLSGDPAGKHLTSEINYLEHNGIEVRGLQNDPIGFFPILLIVDTDNSALRVVSLKGISHENEKIIKYGANSIDKIGFSKSLYETTWAYSSPFR